ncbi:MAG: proline dehydrogenase family protein [Acidimicrobiia bacterium]|nr:MAG: proline dehydrogenase family protein [Acidimicrobiia bacterium]
MIRSVVLGVTERSVTRRLVADTRVGRRVVKRFVAGEKLEAAVCAARSLNDKGLKVSLDHLGEHVTNIEDAVAAKDAYITCLAAIDEAGLDANISVKLTQLGMGFDDRAAERHVDEIAAAAGRVGMTVTVDMEESAYTETTIGIYEAAQKRHGNLGIAIQAYLLRSAADLDRIIPLGGHVRLCKGAYAESEKVAYQSRSEIDRSYDRLAALLMSSSDTKPAIASHDDGRLEPVLEMAANRKEPWEFQMLYGVRRDRQHELVRLGYDVRVYVPYGEAWYPYLTRRLAERPANLMFFARALVGG